MLSRGHLAPGRLGGLLAGDERNGHRRADAVHEKWTSYEHPESITGSLMTWQSVWA